MILVTNPASQLCVTSPDRKREHNSQVSLGILRVSEVQRPGERERVTARVSGEHDMEKVARCQKSRSHAAIDLEPE